MKTYIAFIIASLLLAANVVQAQHSESNSHNLQEPPQGWYKQNSPTAAYIGAVSFPSRDTGYVGNGAGLYRTTNGGAEWLPFGPPNAGFARFVDSKTGWAFRGPQFLYKTTDGGLSWKDTQNTNFTAWQSLRFFNRNVGYVIGTSGISYTTDGGRFWTVRQPPGYFDDIAIFDSLHALLVGGPYGMKPEPICASVQYTETRGNTWNQPSCIPKGFHGVSILDSTTVIAVGRNSIFKITDRGIHWIEQTVPAGLQDTGFNKVWFSDSLRGTIVGDHGVILRTTNGGANWFVQNSTVTTDLTDVCFTDSLHGTAVGDIGTILHTIDGGKSWVKQYLPFDSISVQTFPEPVTSSLSIHYTIPSPQHVTITLYDLTGKVVQVLLQNDFEQQGEHTIPVMLLPQIFNGTYFYKFQTEKFLSTGKISVIR